MRASWIFSKNDVIANTGVIIGGVLVWLLDTRWPDLVIGVLIALVILNGARHIILDAKKELDEITKESTNQCSSSCQSNTCVAENND